MQYDAERDSGMTMELVIARVRTLAHTTSNCVEANASQLWMYVGAGSDWSPVQCPHCGQIPTIEELTAIRKPCSEFGHPEQMDMFFRLGKPTMECILCGETPAIGGIIEGQGRIIEE